MSDDEEARMDSVEPGEERDAADEELVRVCGSSHLADLARRIWREMEKEQLLDASDQRLVDEDVRKLMNGLHTIARQTGFLTERMRPFPCEEINFSGNPMSRVGCGEVVQFARTHGCNAKSVDMSHCDLDDLAATEELSRLVKNSGTWRGSSTFLNKLKLRGNRIGRNGASKLAQYAHWARVGYNSSTSKESLPPVFTLDLSDNIIDKPLDLADELVSKKIKVSTRSEPEDDTTVHLIDFDDQRPAPAEPPPRRPAGGRGREPPRRRDEERRPPRGGTSYSSGECWDFQVGKCFRGAACKFSHNGSGRDRRPDRGRGNRDDPRGDRYGDRSRSRDRRADRRGYGRDRRGRSDSRDHRGRSDSRDRRGRSGSRDRRGRSDSRDRRGRSESHHRRGRSDSRDKRARGDSRDKRGKSASMSCDRRSASAGRDRRRGSRYRDESE